MPYKDKQQQLQYWRDYRKKNRPKIALQEIARRENRRPAWDLYQRKYRETHKAKTSEYHKVYYHGHKPEKRAYGRVYKRLRRMKKLYGASPTHEANKKFITAVRSSPKVKCYYCAKEIPGIGAHIDHVFPICPRVFKDKRGDDSIGNLCVSCPDCNRRKSDLPIGIWIKQGQQILAL